ncbi:MAG: hypothetical protein RL621_40 [Bacteroidota bacterium]|jgi:hypothetical protein
MKIFKNGKEFVAEPPKEIEFSFCFYTHDGLKKILGRKVVGISDYIHLYNGARFKKFELTGNYMHEGVVYDLIKATYTLRGEEMNNMLLGKFNDGVINIKDHGIEVCGAKEDSSKKRRSISFLYNANGLDIRTRSDSPIHHLDKIKEIHCYEKILFKENLIDLIIVKWVDGHHPSYSDTFVYYGYFNDGVL